MLQRFYTVCFMMEYFRLSEFAVCPHETAVDVCSFNNLLEHAA